MIISTAFVNSSLTENPKKFYSYSYIKQKRLGESNILALERNNVITDKRLRGKDQFLKWAIHIRVHHRTRWPTTNPRWSSIFLHVWYSLHHPQQRNCYLTSIRPKLLVLISPTGIQKMVAAEVAPILAVVFQQSYITGNVTTARKNAYGPGYDKRYLMVVLIRI